MTWIKCSDHLPEECETVLVYVPDMNARAVAYLIYDDNGHPISYNIVDLDESEGNLSLSDVTHWMPLPEPPSDCVSSERSIRPSCCGRPMEAVFGKIDHYFCQNCAGGKARN